MTDKVVSYRSTLLYEPLIACLCSEHPGVRSLATKIFQKIHMQFRSKHPSLLQLYLHALQFPNTFLTASILHLIHHLLYYSQDIEKMVPDGTLFKFASKLSSYLDSDTPKVALMAMNSLVGICVIWPHLGFQEVLREILDEEAYGYLIDRVDENKNSQMEEQGGWNGAFLMGHQGLG